MLTRFLCIFACGAFLIGLTSCGPKETTEIVTTPPPSVPKTKPKPTTPPSLPSPLPSESQVHKIGFLVPLTGPQAKLGKGLLDAAEMALFDSEISSIKLLPQDTTQGAHQAALKALDEGAELLLGPVFAADVEKVKPLMAARNVNLISFSTDQNVAGGGTFILGFLPTQQIEKVSDFAKEKGLTRIAAFTPDNQYGHLIDQTLKHMNAQGKIQLLGITHYTRGDLLEGNPGNVRLLEEVTAYKTQGLQALIIPEGGENLSLLTQLLAPQMPLKILGSGQWDAPETLRIANRLEGSVFASTNSQERQNFESRFQRSYGYIPPRIATLSYDATALAAALSNKGYTLQTLTFPQGFAGIDGVFRLTPQGLNERALSILEVTPTGFKTLAPAADSF